MKKIFIVLFSGLLFSFYAVTTLSDCTWHFVKLTDAKANRNIDLKKTGTTLYFSKEHLLLKTCAETHGKYSFIRPGKIKVQWGFVAGKDCSLHEQQLEWYCKNRFSDLLYSIEGDSLLLQDVSGVTYKLVKL